MRLYRFYAILLGALVFVSSANLSASQSAPLQARSSDVGGVRVVVQPRTNAPVDGKWEFNVIMDTHTKPLTVDLAHASVLVDDTGQRVSPAVWQGDPPGGHHRRGVLQFLFKGAKPKSIEVQINGIEGSEMRAFKWQLN